MSRLNKLMGRGFIPPLIHGLLDYPLAAVLLAGPSALKLDSKTAKAVAPVFGVGATVLAVGTDWQTGIVHVIPPLLHGYADIVVTSTMIVLPFAAGFSNERKACAFYVLVGTGGLLATLATRFEPRTAT
jgi:hypothetical protein